MNKSKSSFRKILVLLTVLIVATFSVALFGCKDKGITAIKGTVEQLHLQIGKTVDINSYLEITGVGKLNYVLEGDCLSIDGSVVKGESLGVGKVTVYSESTSASIAITVVDVNLVTVRPLNTVVTYDGNSHNIEFAINGQVPEGVTVNNYLEGKPFYGAVEPGKYRLKVVATSDKYNVKVVTDSGSDEVTLMIDRINLNTDNLVRFPSATYVYDGVEKSVTLNFIRPLPDGVKYTYRNNKGTKVGVYEAEVVFEADEKYFYPILPKTARLTIEQAYFDIDTAGFVDTVVTYDGKAHTIALAPDTVFPRGLTVEYFYYKGAEPIEPAQMKEVGKYTVVAKFVKSEEFDDNYSVLDSKTVTLTVTKADLDISRLKWGWNFDLVNAVPPSQNVDITAVFRTAGFTVGTGADYDFGLRGELPKGVNGELNGRIGIKYLYFASSDTSVLTEVTKLTKAGYYRIFARFVLPDEAYARYNSLVDLRATFTMDKGEFSIDGVSFEGGTFEFDNLTKHFALIGADTTFYENFEVKYYLTNLSQNLPRVEGNVDGIYLTFVDNYKLEAVLEYKKQEHKDNYNKVATPTAYVYLTPKEINLPELTFTGGEYTYDGSARTVTIKETLPEGVSAVYTDNVHTDAGSCTPKARLKYLDVGDKNYIIKINGVEQKTLVTELKIKPADQKLTPEEVAQLSRVDGGVYSPSKTLADYVLQPYVFWREPTKVPTVGDNGGYKKYSAYYNRDRKNYVDYNFYITLEITPIILDGSDFIIGNQFLPYSGVRQRPLITSKSVADINALAYTEGLSSTDMVGYGKHTVTNIKIKLKDTINYRLINAPSFAEATIYVYDGAIFEYSGTQLTKYKGVDSYVAIPDGTTSIYTMAIANNSRITHLVIPSSVVSIGGKALFNLSALESLTVPYVGQKSGDKKPLGSIFGVDNADLPSNLKRIIVSDQTTVYAESFRMAKYLTEVDFVSKATEIQDRAFYGCAGLITANFPDAQLVGESAFYGCSGIKTMNIAFLGRTVAEPKTMVYLFGINAGNNLYADYALSVINLTGSQTTLATDSFRDFINLTEIILPQSLSYIGETAFFNVKAKVTLNDNFTVITSRTFSGYKGTELILPETLTAIESHAFADANRLVELRLPKGVTDIREYAFGGCSATVVFAVDGTISEIKDSAFRNYAGTSVTLPYSVKTIGDNAFRNSTLTGIRLNSGITTLGSNIFDGCRQLAVAQLNTENVGDYMFNNCISLNNIEFGENVGIINMYAFYGCSALENVVIKSNITRIDANAFNGCPSLAKCIILGSNVSLGDNAFRAIQLIRVNSADLAFYTQKYGKSYLFQEIG